MYVYVIVGGRRHIKIGIAKDVKKRLAGIQTGCPFTLRLVRSYHTTRAREIERRAHKLLAKYRWAGEWFDVPHRVAALVVENLVRACPSYGTSDKAVSKAIVFCRSCRHSAVLEFIPDIDARLRCSKCDSREHAHVIDFMINLLDSSGE